MLVRLALTGAVLIGATVLADGGDILEASHPYLPPNWIHPVSRPEETDPSRSAFVGTLRGRCLLSGCLLYRTGLPRSGPRWVSLVSGAELALE
jgi:hypothetical protein